MNAKDQVEVVAGILIEDQRVLLAQRSRHRSFPLLWEFPGGKVEPGETPEAALRREFLEELGIEIEPSSVYTSIAYPGTHGGPVRVVFYRVNQRRGEPQLLDVEAVIWAGVEDLDQLDIIPANVDVMARLREEMKNRAGETKESEN